jgi:hypothetical protein
LESAALVGDAVEDLPGRIAGTPNVAYMSTMMRGWLVATMAYRCEADHVTGFIRDHPTWFDMGVRLVAFAYRACSPSTRDRICKNILDIGDGDPTEADIATRVKFTYTPGLRYEIGRIVLDTVPSGSVTLALTDVESGLPDDAATRSFFQQFTASVQCRLMTLVSDGYQPLPTCSACDFAILGSLLGRLISQGIPIANTSWTAFFNYIDGLQPDDPKSIAFNEAFCMVFPRAPKTAYLELRRLFTLDELTSLITLDGAPWLTHADPDDA